ncbi:MAG: SDR family oxidoreductase [candidate division NC10 bacterium]|nr:SDR family oxidoreductase [candidate division NC10 bacterium]
MATYLVTGGAGFIGSHLVHALVERGEQVRVLDNLSTGRLENLAPLLDRVELVEGDLQDFSAVKKAVEEVEGILHQGALPSVARSVEDPFAFHAANATGTLNLLIAAKEAGVRRVIYASSSSVYGDSPTLPKEEGMKPDPKSPYAISKLMGEYYCQVFHWIYGLETVVLRYFNVFGPRQDPHSPYAAVIPRFISAMLEGRSPVIFGDGLQSRDFTSVENVVEANLLTLSAKEAAGEVINVACGERSTLLTLVEILNRILGTRFIPRFEAPRPGDVRHSQASIEKAERLLGYKPKVGFEEGLRRTVDWMKKDKRDQGPVGAGFHPARTREG